MQALGGPSSPQSPWEFASVVGSPHANGFVIGMEELGEPLGFPSCCVDGRHRSNEGRDCLRAGAGGGPWGEGAWTGAPVPEL